MPNSTNPNAVLSGSGWMQQQLATVLLTHPDHGIPIPIPLTCELVLCSGSVDTTLRLPSANSVAAGLEITVKMVDLNLNQVKIWTSGLDLVEGDTAWDMFDPLSYVTLVCDGVSNWWVVGQGGAAAIEIPGGLGVFNTSPPTTQPALCVTLADVIAVLVGCGLCASS
jgi:hypothetical protein